MKHIESKKFRLCGLSHSVKTAISGVVLSSIMLPLSADALAEESAKEQPSDLEVISVTGVRGSLSRALNAKRFSNGVTDAIASEDFADFPDLNIGEALQRVTGVTLERSDNGEGGRISVRGLPSDFVRTTLNGITAASSATDGSDAIRAFDFNIFASELFSAVELNKSGSADQAEGGIAATVNLQTPRPFDYDSRKVVASVSGQHAELSGPDNIDPRFAFLALDTWNDGKVGAAISVAYSDVSSRGDLSQRFRYQRTGDAFLNNTLNGADRVAGTDDDLTQDDLNRLGTTINGQSATIEQLQNIANNSITDSLPRVGPNVLNRERLGVTTSFQFIPAEDIVVSADLLYATYDDIGQRATIDGLTGFNRRGVMPIALGVETINGQQVLSSATLNNITQRTETVEDKFASDFVHFTLDTEWAIDDSWQGFFQFGYSNSQTDELRRTYLYQHTGQFSYDLTSNRDHPLIAGDFDYLDASAYQAGGFRYRPRTREDEESSFRADFTHSFDLDSALDSLQFGVRLSDKEVSQLRGELRGDLDTFNAITNSGFGNDTPFADIAASVTSIADGFLQGAPTGTPRDFLIIDYGKGAQILPESLTNQIDNDPLSSWIVAEKTSAFYLKTNWAPEWGQADLGVRIVRTEQTSTGSQSVGGSIQPISVDNTYTDVLPSLNVRFDVTDDVIMRFAANKAITRPTLGQLSPGTSIFPTLLSARGGNPELDPFRATQYDLSFEWYFVDEGLLAATLFYKDISSFITSVTTQEVITGTGLIDDDGNNVSGSNFTVTRPGNGEGGELSGIELTYQQPFADTGFGILANATFADSTGTFEQGKSRLNGQSDLSYNLITYYENETTSLRLAYSHRSDYRTGFTSIAGLTDEFIIDDRNQLDLSASYKVNEQLTISFDALNLTGEDTRRIAEAGLLNRYTDQGSIYVLGARYTF